MTALAIVWSLLLDPVIGIIPYLLSILGIYGVEFLKDPALAMPSIILMTVWKNFGFTMVILVAGVQAIPGVYYEAAGSTVPVRLGNFSMSPCPCSCLLWAFVSSPIPSVVSKSLTKYLS